MTLLMESGAFAHVEKGFVGLYSFNLLGVERCLDMVKRAKITIKERKRYEQGNVGA